MLLAALGFVLGVALAYAAALVWNPDSYEATLPLLLAGAVAGPALAVALGRRRARSAAQR